MQARRKLGVYGWPCLQELVRILALDFRNLLSGLLETWERICLQAASHGIFKLKLVCRQPHPLHMFLYANFQKSGKQQLDWIYSCTTCSTNFSFKPVRVSWKHHTSDYLQLPLRNFSGNKLTSEIPSLETSTRLRSL